MILCALFLLPPGAPLQGPLGVPGERGQLGRRLSTLCPEAAHQPPLRGGSASAGFPFSGLDFGLDFRFLAWIWLRISALA